MAKLVKKRYRKLNGEIGINNYFAFISKSVINDAGWTGEEQVNVYAQNNKIVIERR